MLANARSNSLSEPIPRRHRRSNPFEPDDLSTSANPSSTGAKCENNEQEDQGLGRPSILSRTDFETSCRSPTYDREVDFLVATNDSVNQAAFFEQLLPQCHKDTAVHPLFTLPQNIRYQIYGLCFPEESRKITLAPQFATGSVFFKDYFANPWVILADVWGGLASSRALRHELMTYFWTEYSFHLTLSPFSGPKFSPLTCIWLPNYLGIIQKLSIEIDLTRFSGSLVPHSSECRQCERKLERMLADILIGLLDRPPGLTISELHLLCRRWCSPASEKFKSLLRDHEEEDYKLVEKSRTSEDKSEKSMNDSDSDESCDLKLHNSLRIATSSTGLAFANKALAPQTPEEILRMSRMVIELRDLLQKLRISGFPLRFASDLFVSVFGHQERSLEYIIPMEPAWPSVVSQSMISSPTASRTTSMASIASEATVIYQTPYKLRTNTSVSQASSQITNDIARLQPEVVSAPESQPYNLVIESPTRDHLNIELHTSRSFVDEVDDGITKIQEAPLNCHSSYTTTPKRVVSIEPFPDLDTGTMLEDRIHSYSFLSPTSSSSDTQSTPNPKMTNAHLSTPRFQTTLDKEPALQISSGRPSPNQISPRLSPASHFPLRTSSLRASTTRCSSPGTINRINDLNEKDPAFLRTLNAMRSSKDRGPSSETSQGLFSMISSTITTSVQTTIQGENSESNVKRRYGGFFSKLRGS